MSDESKDYKEVEYITIPINSVHIENRQRQSLGDIDILAFSIAQYGQFVPIVVQDMGNGRYRLVDGERRLQACRHNNSTLIKAIIYENLNEIEQQQIELELNVRREALKPIEEARAVRSIFAAEQKRYLHKLPGRFGRGFTQKDLSKKLDKSESTISMSLKMAEAADIDPTLELLSSKREIQKRMRENTTLPIAGGITNQLAADSMIVDDCLQFLDKQQTATIDLAILDIDTIQSALYPILYKKLKLSGSIITFCPIVKIAQLHSQLLKANFFVMEEPYIWHCTKEETYKSFLWAGKNREKPLRYMSPHISFTRGNNVHHSKAKPYPLMAHLIKANTEGMSTVAILPCYDFASVKACIDNKRNVKAVFETQTLRDVCLLNAEQVEN